MRVVVGYASAHGSTREIAAGVAERLTRAGIGVDLVSMDELDAIVSYDAAVLGSAIHNMTWLPEATSFVETHRAELLTLPVWIFSVSSIGDTTSFFSPRIGHFMGRKRKEPSGITGIRQAIQPRDHRNFAGVVERSHWSLGGRFFLRIFGGSYGDHRDWPDIQRWADAIAQQLFTQEKKATG